MKCPNWRDLEDGRELGDECPDPEACQSNWPCYHVRRLATQTAHKISKENPVTHGPTDEAKARVDEALRDWWNHTNERDIERVVPKAVEYGATDLAELGRTFALITNRDLASLSHEEATEIGIYLYLVGKMSRWTDAIKNGRRPSQDTVYDIKIYATMAQRNIDVGGWPFPPDYEADTPLPVFDDGAEGPF